MHGNSNIKLRCLL